MQGGQLEEGSWWTRACGGREVLSIALPLVISTMSWTLMNLVDRMFLLWHSQEEMAAAAPAGFLLFTWMCLPIGIAAYANTFVAQYYGSGNPDRIGVAVWQAVILACLVAPLFFLTIPVAEQLFRFGKHPPQVQIHELTYYRVVCVSAGAAICSAALSTYFTGRGETRVVMVVDVGAAIVNVVLDYLFVFGHAGFPEGGIEGAAWATTISQWGKTFVYFGLILVSSDARRCQVRAGMRLDNRLLGRLIYFGGPDGLRMLVEMSALTGFLMLLGRLGEQALAATTLAFNINGVAFIPLIGMGIAVSTLVGQHLGQDRVDLAARATTTALVISMAYTILMAVVYLGIPDLLLSGHAWGASAEEFGALRDVTTVLLRFVAIYCVMDAFFIIFLSAIKGAGDMQFVLLATILMAPLPVVSAWIGLRYFGWGLMGCWTVLTIWITLNGLIYAARYLQGNWRTMRVIEPELL